MTSHITVIRNAERVVAYDAARKAHAYLSDGDVAFDRAGFIQVGGRYEGGFGTVVSGRG